MPSSLLPKFFFIISATILTHSYIQCLDHQKTLLLELKNELIFNSSISTKLVQWNQRDECCKWYGVECDAAGNVISLQLDFEAISGGIGDSSSLLRLMYLQKLNLAHNNFNYSPIPKGIHNLTYLTHLNLSHAAFGGQVPAEISSLRRLVSLDISIDLDYYIILDYSLQLEYPNLEMLLQNMTGIRELYLDGVFLSSDESTKWSHIISSYLPNITSLSLRNCGLSGPLARSFWKLHSLSILRLDFNDLSTALPDLFANFSSLTTLTLSGCGLKGSILSTLANLNQLIYVDLSHNLFTGSLSSTLFEGLSNLVYLDLGDNSFSGNIPHSLFRLPLLTLRLSNNQFNGNFQLDKLQSLATLTVLDLSYSNLSVDTSDTNSSAYRLPKLKVLGLASCNLYHFPDFIKHSDITKLDLSNNRIVGEIPSWIWGTQLQELYLSYNLLTHVQKPYRIHSSLELLDLRSNQLWGEMHQFIPPNIKSNLRHLLLANNSLSGSIPTSLCTTTSLELLDLSYNKLSGNIPPCRLEKIRVLDLGGNNIRGHIPDNFSLNCMLQYFALNNNTLEGKIPKSLESCKLLEFMSVGNNIINDTFPCMLSSTLRVLILGSNKLHGEVKCHKRWPELQIVDISSNNFSGSLESFNFSSWSTMMSGSDAQLGHASAGSNSLGSFGLTLILKGLGMQLARILPEFNAIDFSCNNFHGEIPNAIGDLSSLYHLNFSRNALNGSIPKSFGQLRELESLDLSQNQLTGTIPVELGRLSFLQVLNLSYNKLSGEIPNDPHFQTFSVDSFEGNPELCGFNLNISCTIHTGDDSDISPAKDENEEEIEWEYVSGALGYVVGLGSIVWLLLFCPSFRQKYFDKIDEVIEEILNARDRRRRRPWGIE